MTDIFTMAVEDGITPLKVDENQLFITGGYRAGSLMLELAEDSLEYEVTESFRIPRGSQARNCPIGQC